MHFPWPIALLVFAVCFTLGLIVLIRSRTAVATTNPFSLALLLGALWAGNYAVDLGTSDLATKVWLLRTRFLVVSFYSLVWFEMIYRFALGKTFLTRRKLALALIVPVFTVIFAWLPTTAAPPPVLGPGSRGSGCCASLPATGSQVSRNASANTRLPSSPPTQTTPAGVDALDP